MTELVAGAFLSSFFQVIFDKLASSNFTDYLRRGKLDKLVEELESTLESINQVLDDAEIKQYQIPNVKRWLGDVKHAMYEADQLLDEIATDAPLKKMRVESQPSSSTIFNFIPTFTNPFKSRLKELIESIDSLAEQKDKLQLKTRVRAYNGDEVDSKLSEKLPTTYLVDVSQIYGRDDEKNEMAEFLLSNNNTCNQTPVCSILGLGGMGKTTFAKLVYNDSRIEDHFELKAWVYVSESFDVVGLTKAILKSFHSPADDESIFNLLQQRLQRILTSKKYLLVLDDIWNRNAECWEQLLLPFNHGSYGSKIIVTTRDKEVANVLKSTKLLDLQKLGKSDCWSLFATHAFHGKNVCENPNLESIGKRIVEKCRGLPLAVKTIGQLLRKKFSQHEWMKILETDMWRLSDGDNNINPVLRLSYHNLPSNQKRCFAYCSIFPKGYWFRKGELIRIWMAEGLLKSCRTEKSEEELGNEILGYLVSISFFQQSFFCDNYFDMHDLVNDLAKSVSGEFCMRMDDVKVEGSPERTRHIRWSLKLNFVENLLEPICELKRLRSLFLKGPKSMLISNNVQRHIFSRLKYLRMLSFNGCGLSEVVDEIGNLKLLRYLDLSLTGISGLPDTICMLCNLQTLLLGGCSKLTELPSSFSKLINLRHLELPYSLKKTPKNTGSLSNLQNLTNFIVEKQSGSDLKELEKLNHLRGTIHIKGLGKVIDPTDVTTRSLKDKKYLEEIKMTFDGVREDMDGSIVESNVSVLETLQPNSNLKILTISEYRGNSFPNWVSGCHLLNLVSLTLVNCGLCSHFPPLGQIPSLKKLYISGCHGIKIIRKEFYSNNFKSLENLSFANMDNLEEWLCIEGFPLLKELYITDCPKLKRALPQHLSSLEILVIGGCKMLDIEIPNGDNCPSLQTLEICNCEMLDVSIDNGDNNMELDLLKCDQILINESSSKLKYLQIQNCPKLIASREELGLFQLNSLQQFLVSDEFMESFPEENLLPPSLKSLHLEHCSKLRSMDYKGFLHLKFLDQIYIWNCPSLERLPEESLPSLNTLIIDCCPLLEEKYKKKGGECWHTISHIPSVLIDGIQQHLIPSP